MAVYDDVKRALQDIMAPQLAEMRADMDARFAQVETRFAQVDARLSELRFEMDSRFAQVNARLSELRSEMNSRFAEMRQETNNIHTDLVRIEQVFTARLQTVEVVERVARLEERLART